VLLGDIERQEEVEQVTDRMREVLAEPMAIEGQEVTVTSSIGVALYPRDGEAAAPLLRKADLAMYRAKDLGRNTVQFYAPDLDAQATKLVSRDVET
jgi:diguanylate cyclase (GGDEF)-like protein